MSALQWVSIVYVTGLVLTAAALEIGARWGNFHDDSLEQRSAIMVAALLWPISWIVGILKYGGQ